MKLAPETDDRYWYPGTVVVPQELNTVGKVAVVGPGGDSVVNT